MQAALFAARDTMAARGVDFPARTRHSMEAALAACARPAMMGDTVATEGHWRRLVEQLQATGTRTSVVSSEFFADAEGHDTVARIVRELGGPGALAGEPSRGPRGGSTPWSCCARRRRSCRRSGSST
ncbi:hypothetical protein ACWGJX_45290 [Streptomyces sp. NPDC054775]|uniref:hypothetical protein n=1 Tax=unclassified Streptomyces TaxID=2593676 RepID=UPI0029C0325C|nr:hypothetical protein [Streptomyces sp. MI02-2A]